MRIIDAFTQYLKWDGSPSVLKPNSGGKLHTYESESVSTPKATYSQSDQDIDSVNSNPIILTSEGYPGDVFGTGAYKIVLTDSDDVVLQTYDPVGSTEIKDQFDPYNSDDSYSTYDIVFVSSNDTYYRSRVDENTNNDPTSSPVQWEIIPLNKETWTKKTANWTSYGWGNEFIDASTTGGAWELELHASPSDGDKVGVHDYDGTFESNNLTVSSADSEDIAGVSEDFECNIDNLTCYFVFESTIGWKVL